MSRRVKIAIALSIVCVLPLSACSTTQLPNIDFMKLPEFREAAAKLTQGFPKVGNAPNRPTDVRSAAEWDAAAKAIIADRESLSVPPSGEPDLSDAEIAAKRDALIAQARRYQSDDAVDYETPTFPTPKPRPPR